MQPECIVKKIRIIFGVLIILAAVCIFLYPNLREWMTQSKVDQIIEDFDSTDQESVIDNSDSENSENGSPADETNETNGLDTDTQVPSATHDSNAKLYDEMCAYNESLVTSGQVIADAWSGYQQEMVHFDSLEDDLIGYIEIPDMDVRLPLYVGASSDHLDQGAAVLSGTSMPIGGENTNSVIAGHRGWRGGAYFQYIENMQIGSLVYVTNPWEKLTYEVTQIEIIYPSDIDSVMIQEGKDMITLLTCHPYMGGGRYRYLVYCVRADETTLVPTDETSDTDTVATAGNTSGDPTTQDTDVPSGTGEDVDLVRLERALRQILPAITLVLIIIVICVRCFGQKNRKGV